MGEDSGLGDGRLEATTEVGQEPPSDLSGIWRMLCCPAGEVVKMLSGRGHAQCGSCLVGGHVLWKPCPMGTVFSESRVPQGPYPNQGSQTLWEPCEALFSCESGQA